MQGLGVQDLVPSLGRLGSHRGPKVAEIGLKRGGGPGFWSCLCFEAVSFGAPVPGRVSFFSTPWGVWGREVEGFGAHLWLRVLGGGVSEK